VISDILFAADRFVKLYRQAKKYRIWFQRFFTFTVTLEPLSLRRIGLRHDTAPGWWRTVAGPVAMTLMFWFVSIPMIERRMIKHQPEYKSYRENVPALFPFRFRKWGG